VTVSHQFQQAQSNTAEWLRLATSTLARLTAEAAIIAPPPVGRASLKHVEAVPISERRVLLVAVLEGGAVHQQLVELRDPVTTDHLRKLSARLTAEVGAKGVVALQEVVAERSGAAADQQLVAALAHMLAEHETGALRDVYYDGIQNILAQPEFTETGSIRDMLRLLEDRTRLAEIFPQALGAGEVHVAIGSEHRLEQLRGFSLVFGRYGGDGEDVGYVGVVGPTRMDYARSIGAVRYVGSLMSDLVRVMEGG
jgi:heat-inducible transcriptional repressor